MQVSQFQIDDFTLKIIFNCFNIVIKNLLTIIEHFIESIKNYK